MKTLNNLELAVVSGGFCENMSISQCMDGSGAKAGQEVCGFVNTVGVFLGETAARFVLWCQD